MAKHSLELTMDTSKAQEALGHLTEAVERLAEASRAARIAMVDAQEAIAELEIESKAQEKS